MGVLGVVVRFSKSLYLFHSPLLQACRPSARPARRGTQTTRRAWPRLRPTGGPILFCGLRWSASSSAESSHPTPRPPERGPFPAGSICPRRHNLLPLPVTAAHRRGIIGTTRPARAIQSHSGHAEPRARSWLTPRASTIFSWRWTAPRYTATRLGWRTKRPTGRELGITALFCFCAP